MSNNLRKYRQFSGIINPLSANPTKWSNTLKQFVGKLPTNCLSVFDHFVEFALKGLKLLQRRLLKNFIEISELCDALFKIYFSVYF